MTTPMALEDLGWHEDCRNMIEAWAVSGMSFTAEDLRRSMRTPPHANDWGNAFQSARRSGLIESVGFKESSQPSRKGGIIRMWVRAKENR